MKTNGVLARRFLFVALLVLTTPSTTLWAQTLEDRVVESATTVLDEIMAIPASQIPQALLAEAQAVAILPNVVKGGFVVGLRHGRGVILVRDEAGQWQAPLFASITGGSVGWQVGLQATDVVLVFKTRRSVDGLLTNKITIGVDAAAAAGPVGRQAAAATDARLGAEILSYSRSRGLFAGVSIDGAVLQIDHPAGQFYYQRLGTAADGSLLQQVPTLPAGALQLMNRLATYTNSSAVVANPTAGGAEMAAEGAVPHVEMVRRQLVAASQRLSTQVDDRWKEYLALPREISLAGQTPNAESLHGALDHFATVAADPRYASLTRGPDFVATYQLLREYVALQSRNVGEKLTLPPPPAARRTQQF